MHDVKIVHTWQDAESVKHMVQIDGFSRIVIDAELELLLQAPPASPSASPASQTSNLESASAETAPAAPQTPLERPPVTPTAQYALDSSQSSHFVLAGKAHFRLTRGSESYVFKVAQPRRSQYGTKPFFVSVKDASAEYGFAYLAALFRNRDGSYSLRTSLKTTPGKEAEIAMVKDYLLNFALVDADPSEGGFVCQHVEKCARCGKQLDTKESLERGFGPNCYAVISK